MSPRLPPPSQRSHSKTSLFPCERRRHTVSFLSLLSGTSRTARRLLQIPAYSQGRCELLPKESRAQSRRRALSAAWTRRLKESHFFHQTRQLISNPHFKDSFPAAAGTNCEPKQNGTVWECFTVHSLMHAHMFHALRKRPESRLRLTVFSRP